jgi:hypothetical protein
MLKINVEQQHIKTIIQPLFLVNKDFNDTIASLHFFFQKVVTHEK